MLIPTYTWEVIFFSNWCCVCNKIQNMQVIPTFMHPKCKSKYCKSCNTIYNYNWDESKVNNTVELPGSFIIPSTEILEQLKLKFN